MLEKYLAEFKDKKELYLRIKVRPGAAKSEVKEILEDETIKIAISAPPEKGKANEELIRFLAKTFDVNKNNVKIISGKSEKVKLVKIIS
ncbi:MAG: DUF167 domain-containing protein [Bacteriovorax sp.]|nr:DUF167 domain-containing protein [Bacteriovorax sp.]